MSVLDLRAGLLDVTERLPVAELASARDAVESVREQLVRAWAGGEHALIRAAFGAASAATDQLSQAAAGLDAVETGVVRYAERM